MTLDEYINVLIDYAESNDFGCCEVKNWDCQGRHVTPEPPELYAGVVCL